MKKHPDELVARIKAAREAGIPEKVVARETGVPYLTVRDIYHGVIRVNVQPDPTFSVRLALLFKGPACSSG